ncbi:hypothetical protein L7F22_061622 [Adiantum nelumboides]|nr:hypothetical protein [Adiantum nelumboides]
MAMRAPPPPATAVILHCLLLLSQALPSVNVRSASAIILNASAAAVPSQEVSSLLELKARLVSTSAASQALLRGWNASNLHNICKNSSWTGVSCGSVSGQSHITAINLRGSGLAGSLSPHLGNLTFLSTLDLSSNLLTGPIPPELSGCSSLQTLHLYKNSLTGTIPPSLASLPALQHLLLCYNNLSGAIPPPLFTNSTSLLRLSLCANALIGFIPTDLCGSLQGHPPRLQYLHLWQNNLTGTIPSSLGNCTRLVALQLSINALSGHIPSEIGILGQLQSLLLAKNRLEGAIPSSLGMCRNLIELDLNSNDLTGSIPEELGALTNLTGLWLWKNHFTGAIPGSLSNCTRLVDLQLQLNVLSGHIPSEIGILGQLQSLWLGPNRLEGAIPSSLGMCTNLIELTLNSNQLTGSIPTELGALTNLRDLYLTENNLTGAIPSSLGNCTRLVALEADTNQLSGLIPGEIGVLGQLESLAVSFNRLVGAIPSTLGNCTSLILIQLASNQLSGFIPTELGQLVHLQILLLWKNKLKGMIPETLGNCTGLAELALGHNELRGFLPAKFMTLKHLQKLDLNNNHLLGFQVGPIHVSNASSLIAFDMHSNEVSGTIPHELGQLQGLQFLNLGDNQLAGNIPWDSLSNCTFLYLLDLSNNKLAGGLSGKLGGLQKLYLHRNLLQGPIADLRGLISINLQYVNLSFNRLNGILPDSFYETLQNVLALSFSHNHLSGNLPPWLGGLLMVKEMDLSHNQFVGIVPGMLGDLLELRTLNVSWNNLTGEFAQNFNIKSELISLDLSGNGLTGLLPSTLGLLKHLQFLNISFNNFEGPIPPYGVFKHLDASCFQGNTGLCGEVVHKPCSSHHDRQAPIDLKIRILIGLAASLVVIMAILAAICYYRHWQKCQLLAEVDSKFKALAETRHFSARELWESTQGYSEQNLLGEGAVGKVYKGVLANGELVAVKKIKDEIACSARDALLQEVHILSKLRHRNLVKILGCVLNLEEHALVMAFVPNGSLEQYLYQVTRLEDERRLSFDMILQIVQGIANALAYLHHEHDAVPIIHGDVKPSNILLDSELQAHLADFGLAKLAKNSTGDVSLTSNFKGSIGYMAPEFAYAAKITTKVDIYSFGVVILEMMTGRGPTNELLHGVSLHDWVKQNLLLSHDGTTSFLWSIQLLAPSLQSSSLWSEIDPEPKVRLLLRLAVACTEQLPMKRPTAQDMKAFLDSHMVSISKRSVGPNVLVPIADCDIDPSIIDVSRL